MKIEKTNNPCEIFNKLLNSRVSLKNPRISYLIDNIFNLISSNYKECCDIMISTIKKKLMIHSIKKYQN